jgi:hypothetical protein
MYCFFGDSHSRQFVGVSWGIFNHQVFSGATIKGLMNSQSVTGHTQLIRHTLKYPTMKTAFFMFGAVDLDFTQMRALDEHDGMAGLADFMVTRARIYYEKLFQKSDFSLKP